MFKWFELYSRWVPLKIQVCMVCMYMTAFASISSTALKIEVLSFAGQSIQKELTKECSGSEHK